MDTRVTHLIHPKLKPQQKKKLYQMKLDGFCVSSNYSFNDKLILLAINNSVHNII